MSDLIDRQMLKADLFWGYNEEHDYCFPCKKILERIDNQPPAQPEQRWIPCSERLPEEGQSILVTTTNGWHVVAIIRTFFKDMHKDIIAWMPLPEPYREDKE